MGVVIKDFTKVRPHWIRLLIEMSRDGYRIDRVYGGFDRRFILQDNADAEKVNAVQRWCGQIAYRQSQAARPTFNRRLMIAGGKQ